MKLNRHTLRRIILEEIARISESQKTSIQSAIDYSKENPDEKVPYFDAKDDLIHILINGDIDETLQNAGLGTKVHKKYAMYRGEKFGFA